MWTSKKRARYDRSKLRYPSDMTDEVDTLGLLLHAVVHPANVQDRDGAILVMATLFGMFPFFQKLFADGGYQGPEFSTALAKVRPHLNVEIVKRSDQAKGFVVLHAGLSSARLLGSIAAEGSPRIGRTAIERRSRSCNSPQFGSCFENFVIRPKVSGQTLSALPRES